MKNEIIARFLGFHAGGDDKLQINFAWPYVVSFYKYLQNCDGFTNP